MHSERCQAALSPSRPVFVAGLPRIRQEPFYRRGLCGGGNLMDIMIPPARTAQPDLGTIASATSETCIATRVRQLSRIVTRVYDDALRPHKITASQFTLLTQLAQTDGITAAEIGLYLDIEKST